MSVRSRERSFYQNVENERRWLDGCNSRKAHGPRTQYGKTMISWDEAELYSGRSNSKRRNATADFGSAMDKLVAQNRRKQ